MTPRLSSDRSALPGDPSATDARARAARARAGTRRRTASRARAAASPLLDRLPAPARQRLAGWVRTEQRRWRRGGREGLEWSLRLSGAAAAAYLVGVAVLPGSVPLVAALAALLVVQLTPVSLLANGAGRVVAVVAGVAVAAGFAAAVDLSWWSLGAAVATSTALGLLLRLGANAVEVPISTMLVLSAGQYGFGDVAWHRVAETLLGAAVGVAVTMALPPRIVSSDAARALGELADDLADLLERSADELVEARDVPAAARAWVEVARGVDRSVPAARAAVVGAEQSRRLNLRALALPDAGPGLRQALVALENTAVTVRSTYRSLQDAADPGAWAAGGAADVRAATALVLAGLSGVVRAFGDLVVVQARVRPQVGRAGRAPAARERAERERLRAALAALRDARAGLDSLVLADDPCFAELGVTLAGCVRRLLVELDPDRRDRALPAPGRPARLVERRSSGRAAGRGAGAERPGGRGDGRGPDGSGRSGSGPGQGPGTQGPRRTEHGAGQGRAARRAGGLPAR